MATHSTVARRIPQTEESVGPHRVGHDLAAKRTFMAVLGLVAVWLFSGCSKQGLLSGCSVRASRHSGFSHLLHFAVSGPDVVSNLFSRPLPHQFLTNAAEGDKIPHDLGRRIRKTEAFQFKNP